MDGRRGWPGRPEKSNSETFCRILRALQATRFEHRHGDLDALPVYGLVVSKRVGDMSKRGGNTQPVEWMIDNPPRKV